MARLQHRQPPLARDRAGDAPLAFDAPLTVSDAALDGGQDLSSTAARAFLPDDYVAPREPWLAAYRGALLVLLACVALIAATWLAWTPAFEAVTRGAGSLAEHSHDRARWSATVALAAIGLLACAAAWGRATHPRRALRLVGGRGRVSVDALAGGLRALLLDIEHVRAAEVRVEHGRRDRVTVRAWLHVTPAARIDHTLDAVDDAATWLVQDRLRLTLAEPPLVDVRYEELDLRRRVAPPAVTDDPLRAFEGDT